MKYGARNAIVANVKSITSGEIMSIMKFDVTQPCQMSAVLTTESLEDLHLAPGDEVKLIIKAVHVLPIKE